VKAHSTEEIRNVALIGHGGVGKTTLAEAALFAAGVISRQGSVEDGNTVSDYDADELKRKISVNLALAPLEWKDRKVNLIDAPGYADFVGEVKEALRAADIALIVVDAVSGVQVGTEMAFKYASELDLPRAFFINRMDRENADFEQVLDQLVATFGKRIAPQDMPVGAQDQFKGVVDLVSMHAYMGSAKDRQEQDVPAELKDLAENLREKLVEAVAEADDDLLNKYLEGEDISNEEIDHALAAGIAQGLVYPVYAGSAAKNIGVAGLLDAVAADFPSPTDVPARKAREGEGPEVELKADAGGPLAVFVFKTAADPYVGKLTYLRVVSGTLKGDAHAWNANRAKDERVGQLYLQRGKDQEAVPELIAGDIGVVAKLTETQTGDTLATKEKPLVLEEVAFPAPSFSASVFPKGKGDVDKLMPSLTRLIEEDPTLTVRRDAATAETVLSGLGESHLDVVVEKLQRKFGVGVELHLPKVPYRETISIPTKSEYKHKKQTGGHGQYGHVFLEITPQERGSGNEFTEKVVGGAVPRNFYPAVEKGVSEALSEGVVANYPVVDVKVVLYDGSFHAVDSSEMAFKMAASQALKKGVLEANPVLLEPIVSLRVTVPDGNQGDVMGDLTSKRGRVLGMNPNGDGTTTIEAHVPLAEVQRYSTDLRSITQGRGSFELEVDHYEEVPQHQAQKIIEAAKREE
jgi:elongation factor G